MANFGPLTAEIDWRVWGTPSYFNGFRVLAALLHGTLVVGVSQTAELNRGRHLYSAGRPSHSALAHTSSSYYITFLYYCMTGGNIILKSFLWSLLESQTATEALKLGEIYGFALQFWYSLQDTHQTECFELGLIFGFEQSSFGCRKKTEFNIPS